MRSSTVLCMGYCSRMTVKACCPFVSFEVRQTNQYTSKSLDKIWNTLQYNLNFDKQNMSVVFWGELLIEFYESIEILQFVLFKFTADVESNAFNVNCNEPSYIAGLSVLIISSSILGSVCLLLMR